MPLLLKCPTCGHDISINAKSCPNCGEPLENGKVVEKKGNAPVWLLLVSIFQFLLFWIYPLYALFNIDVGFYTPNAFLWFYGLYSLIALLVLLRGVKTAKKEYNSWGVSVATSIISALNSSGGCIIVYILSKTLTGAI